MLDLVEGGSSWEEIVALAKAVEQAGASAFYVGSTIAYDNAVKVKELKVSAEVLAAHGAVSEEVVKEMVAGALRKYGTTYAVATSGIAGPSGGTPDKPVGTIWIAAGDAAAVRTRRLSLGRNRTTNIDYTAVAAIDLLRRLVAFGVERD